VREFLRDEYEALRDQLRQIDPNNPQLETLTSPEYSPSQADVELLREEVREAQARASEPPSADWLLGWARRGVNLERLRLGGPRKLPSNTPVIDAFTEEDGVVTSIKSIDLNAPSYRITRTLEGKIDGYVDGLRSFEELKWGGAEIAPNQIRSRVLDLIVPRTSGSRAQIDAIKGSIDRARGFGVVVRVFYY
jgi:filamentous hemagglutinin